VSRDSPYANPHKTARTFNDSYAKNDEKCQNRERAPEKNDTNLAQQVPASFGVCPNDPQPEMKNATPATTGSGVKFQVSVQNQLPIHRQKNTTDAMRFYWCKATNSVERFHGGVFA
jgi:hypothetical protein